MVLVVEGGGPGYAYEYNSRDKRIDHLSEATGSGEQKMLGGQKPLQKLHVRM